uniref:PPM-type phosphatase domain-containing protein n=1 Tax=Anopheles dirus TaxID=7168 RepID=A0A182ND45_9DIPT
MSIGVNLRVTGHTSIGGRKYQEDYFSVAYQQTENDQNLEYAYFGIYDGHGGAEASLFAKEHLMNTIVSQKLFWSENDDDVLKSIREGYIQTHYSMWREQDKWPKTSSGLPSTAGTTASIAFIRRGKIYIGHVGDSGIVLGYQNDKESTHDGRWVATPLTEDHKPESYAEKMRIMSSGGKVVTKSGVPRVVWNRPRIGHKGPVRRSTPFDEIPFLAVARSLGDLWSYNSAMDEFIVSPVPDVSVIEIDPKKYRCLIFGTDGLWNVMSPKNAVEIVRNAEMENVRIALEGGSEWRNPSKLLVNEALERWSRSNMKADNTSVVIIMLDPPGPPKRDVLKSVKDTIEHAANSGLEHGAGVGAAGSNIIDLFDCITRGEAIPSAAAEINARRMDQLPSMRYLNHHHHVQPQHGYHHHAQRAMEQDYGESDQQQQQHHQTLEQYGQSVPSTSAYHQDPDYTNSYAESYNSVLDRSFDSDHSYTTLFHPTDSVHDVGDVEDVAESSYQNKATMVEPGLVTHDEDDDTMFDYQSLSSDDETGTDGQTGDSTYSLTNLQTKSERLRAEMLESSCSSSPDAYTYHQPEAAHRDDTNSYGNLAIIEHFHNYHHPPTHEHTAATGGAATDSGEETSRIETIGGAMRSLAHHSYHQYQMDEQYQQQHHHHYHHHHHHHHHGDSHYHTHGYLHSAAYQMERYDYRHAANNNATTTVPCEATCSKNPTKDDKPSGSGAYNIHHLHEHLEEVEPTEDDEVVDDSLSTDVDSEHQIISINGHRIQINEVSSSYVGGGGGGAGATKVVLAESDCEHATSDVGMGDSGDEENSACSTTSSNHSAPSVPVVVPVLVKPRTINKSRPSTRVISIFYETRSSRRQTRNCTPSKATGPALVGIVKRRKTVTAPIVRSTIGVPEKGSPVGTLVRRVLRSTGEINAPTGGVTQATQSNRKQESLVVGS